MCETEYGAMSQAKSRPHEIAECRNESDEDGANNCVDQSGKFSFGGSGSQKLAINPTR